MLPLNGAPNDLHTLITTNVPPTEAQARMVHNLLPGVLAEARELDEQYATLQNALAALSLARTQKHKAVTGLQGVISPIRRIPSEILGEIFGHCVQECHRKRISTLEGESAVSVLARVCSRWRLASRGTPHLWDRLLVFAQCLSPRLMKRMQRRAPDWVDELLQRSAARPLEVTICTGGMSADFGSSWFIFGQLSESSAFLQRVARLKATIELQWYRNSSMDTLVFASLHTLDLWLFTPSSETDMWSFCARFRNAPALRNVRFGQNAVAIRRLPPLPFAQLETLELDMFVDVLLVHLILASSFCLRKTIFPRIVDDTNSTIDVKALPAETILPSLEVLLATGKPSEDFPLGTYPLLQSFTLPSLKSLVLSPNSPSQRVDPSLDFLSSFQSRSGFGRLTTLRIVGPLPAAPILAFIQNNLAITAVSKIHETFEKKDAYESHHFLCPIVASVSVVST